MGDAARSDERALGIAPFVLLRATDSAADFEQVNGGPGRTRTCDLRVMSSLLLTAELRARSTYTSAHDENTCEYFLDIKPRRQPGVDPGVFWA